MKKILILTMLAMSIATVFTACERNNYQHPMHRK